VTKRHFTAIAAIFKQEIDAAVGKRRLSEADAVAKVARRIAVELSHTSGSFRFNTFYAECGLTADGFVPGPIR
jgi:hypothetical protein